MVEGVGMCLSTSMAKDGRSDSNGEAGDSKPEVEVTPPLLLGGHGCNIHCFCL